MNINNKFFKFVAGLALTTGALLLIPLVAMQFTGEVVWTLSDFIVAGALLFGTGFTYILVTQILAPQMGDNNIYRVAVGFGLFTGLFLIWSNLAVGIIGSENNPINLLYFGVIFVGIIGAFIAHFQSQGMVYVMIAMALSQALITGFALITGVHHSPGPGITIFHILAVNGFFIVLFVISAMLFHYATRNKLHYKKA